MAVANQMKTRLEVVLELIDDYVVKLDDNTDSDLNKAPSAIARAQRHAIETRARKRRRPK